MVTRFDPHPTVHHTKTTPRPFGAASPQIRALMERFVGLTADEGRALYSTLPSEQQAELDARGLRATWRSMRTQETRDRRRQRLATKFEERVRALEDARRRKEASSKPESTDPPRG
jgi:hypothetical protein